MMRHLMLPIGLVLIAAPVASAQTSYPMITHTVPVAVQRGQSTEVTVYGQMNFAGIYKALFQAEGIKAEILGVESAKTKGKGRAATSSVKMRLTVDAQAELGVRDFRLASGLGISSIGQVVIVDDPVVQESGNNNTLDKANPISLPCVVAGRIETGEDVDTFRFHAEAGQTLTFEVLCARLEDKIHDLQKHADPLLTLLDASGRELAANDDCYFADPLLSFRVPQTGDYFVQVRDAKYDGDPRWVYALLATSRPYVEQVFPFAAQPKSEQIVELIGATGARLGQTNVRAPLQPGLHALRLECRGQRTNPVAFFVSPLPQVFEQEPNDTLAQATRIAIPCGISGRIGQRRDLDYFVFPGEKGKAVRFEVHARRFGTILQSPLDSMLELLDSKGKVLLSNDDAIGKDAALVFAPPADGDYFLRIRDLNHKGGPAAVYYIEADWARPDFALRCDPDKAMIGPGSSTAWYVHVQRSNGFSGPVQVEVQGLPRGVHASPLTIPPSMTQGLLVLTADADAPRDAVNVKVLGKASVPTAGSTEQAITRVATPNEEIYLPGGGRGRFDVGMQTVAVTEPSDILKVAVTPARVILHPGQEVRLDVALQRRPDCDKEVSLDVVLQHLGGIHGNPLPPGVHVVESKSKTLLGKSSTGVIVLRAEPNAAPIEQVPISVLAHVSINFVVKISYSSPPIWLSVQK